MEEINKPDCIEINNSNTIGYKRKCILIVEPELISFIVYESINIKLLLKMKTQKHKIKIALITN